ncbi:type I secretion system permease/ATPase [Tardiphaga alba]|uniref:Type I secretion system permease/ATPase n=1 Tax=Tardiphaga alba TaxID=340268 RepID=A0ABX8A6W5_9BRAD|nr:type I secretion system permease/ATPase [Tardiphaga alba]
MSATASRAANEPGEHDPVSDRRDPLADALLHLAAYHGRAISREALLAGLPIVNGRLTAALVERAGLRAGLEVEPTRRKLADIPALVLPAVLIMRDGTALLLTSSDARNAMADLVDPALPQDIRTVPFEEIERNYSGYAFFIKPLATADARTVAAGDLPKTHWFWSVVRRFGSNYSHVALAALLVNLLALAAPLFTMNVYDRVVPNGAVPSLVALAVGLTIAIAFDFLIRIVRSRIIDLTGKKIDVVLAANIFEHILALKMANRPASVGILANQMRDFDSVREFFTSGTVVAATDLFFAMIFIGVLFVVAGPLAWIPLAMLPIVIATGFILQQPLNRAMKRLQAESAARHGVLIESLSGIEAVRATGAESRMQTAWERSVAATARSGEAVHFWSSLALTISSSAQQITSMLLVVIGVFLILDGKITMGALIAANMLAGRVLAPISSLASVITRATQTISSLRSIDRLMDLERERPPGRAYVARKIEQGTITFNNVSFSYPNSKEKALDNVSFTIAPGERVAIIGRVGSGKTTVGRLLSGFYEPAEGNILIDGIDSRQYDPADLRSGTGFVMQDTDLFFGKLRENITLGKPSATDDEVIEAARLSGVEQFIAGHPLGYDMPIAEGGRSLSGGQKQAIGLARAMIRQPKILFMDEPTAHFDVRSETEFLERLKAIARADMTIIVSTHRPSLLSLVTRILVFERGKLVADGPRENILATLQATAKRQQAEPVKFDPNAVRSNAAV